jgi:sugar phosphate isomerase/epimerase
MFVACSTLCFAREPLETALRKIAEMEFDKFELALVEGGQHLKPSEAGDDPDAAHAMLRSGPSLIPASLYIDFGSVDWSDPITRKRFDGLGRLAKSLSVAVITIHASPLGTPLSDEVKRLGPLVSSAMHEGLVLALLTHADTLTADPHVAVELCQIIPGLGLTLDPSHFLQGPNPNVDFDAVFPHVQNVHLRDTGLAPGEFQVRVGQGQIEYARIVTMLQRYGYNRSLTVAIVDRIENPFDREVEVRKLKLLLETLI